MEIARKSADMAGVKIKTIKAAMEDFDYGKASARPFTSRFQNHFISGITKLGSQC